MPKRSRRSSGSDLLDTAEAFRDLPLVYAIVASALVAALCEVVVPLAAHSSKPASGSVNYLEMFLPFVQIIGGFLAAAILLFGLVGATSRWWSRSADKTRFERQTGVDSIRRLSWQEFERLLGEFYRRQGYEVHQRGGPGADGGADLELLRGNERLLVQAKHWKSWQVRLPQVRELWGAVADEHADGAILVTSGSFTDDARRWTTGKNLILIDGLQLAEVIASIQRPTEVASVPAPTERLHCPKCGRPMVQRIAKQGPFAGHPFLGCTGFPQCRHTEPLGSAPATR
jgi:restriction system protein